MFSTLVALPALVLLISLGEGVKSASTTFDVFRYVDPLIGTANGGHVFPGATLPFGMAKAVADVEGENQGGFASDGSNITGWSHMHDSGTGGGSSLGNFPLFPQSGCPGDVIDDCKWTKVDRATAPVNGSAMASPGYFSVELETQIKGEATVSNHTALYRFSFPDKPVFQDGSNGSTLSPLILADLTDLGESRSNGSISVDPSAGRITGNGTFVPSFGLGTYVLHFCADFSGANIRDTGVFINNRAGSQPKSLKTEADGINDPPLPAGAWVRFEKPTTNNQILARVGVSFISTSQACDNAEKEIPSFDFEDVKTSAEEAWRQKLGVVSIDATGVSDELQTTFWSGMYRSMISPQDYTGENPLWESDQPYYDSYYCIWDSFRSIHPLITLLDPESQTRMVASLIDIYRHEGWLPDCRMSLCKGYTQGGSNADVVLVDSYLKNISADWATGYEAIVKDAEVEPPNWSVQGRGGLASWKELHYIPTDDFDPYGVGPFTRSISRTVEYAYNDFCIAEMAQRMGKTDDYEKYLERSGYWKNMYKADQNSSINGTDTGYEGFLQPKFLNGTWGYQDPILCSSLLDFTSCYLNPTGHETYEGSAWLYTFFAPQDMAGLIATLGGPAAFTARLQYLHHTHNLLYVGDEQAFLTLFLAHYSGRPALSAQLAHFYIPAQFNASVVGIPGNDDSGAMGSFSTLAMMGLWPVSGQDVYLILPPFFPELSLTNALTGKTATVRNVNFDPGYERVFVQYATLDGKPYARNWIPHAFFLDGGVLELVLGREESAWGTREEDLPPSSSSAGTVYRPFE